MGKKNWAAHFLYILWVCAVITILGLIYWSSLLQEEKLQKLAEAVKKLEQEVNANGVGAVNEPSLQTKIAIYPSLPGNILKEDPYYLKTLPRMLGPSFRPHGTLRQGTIGRTDDLHPFSGWAYVTEWMSYVQRGMMGLQFGKYTVFSPEIAYSIEQEVDEESHMTLFTVHLRDDVYWQPLQKAHFPPEMNLGDHFLHKHKLTSHDFVFYFQALKNPHVDVAAAATWRQLLADIDAVVAIDDYTLKISYKMSQVQEEVQKGGQTVYKLPYIAKTRLAMIQPLARCVYQYGSDGNKLCADDSAPNFYQISSVFAQQFAHHFAIRVIPSCGAYIFDGASGSMVRFRRNPDFYEPLDALYDAIEVNLVNSPEAIWRDFMAQKLDLCTLPPECMVELDGFMRSPFHLEEQKKGRCVKTLEYLGRSYSYVAFNFKRPYFASTKVRQALSMAVDYKRMIHQNLYDQGVTITGPFFKESSAYDTQIPEWPFDPHAAKRLLAEEGWYDSDGDGIIDKEIAGSRVPFQFALTYYVKNPISKAYCQMISEFYRALGIDCRLRGVELADLSAAVDDKNFDALFLGWQLAIPPEDPEQLWSSKGADVKGSSNIVGFKNEEIDALIQKLKFETDPDTRIKLYHRVHAILHDEAPYLFLYTPKTTIAYWSWIHNLIIPKEHQGLIPGADVVEPAPLVTWKD